MKHRLNDENKRQLPALNKEQRHGTRQNFTATGSLQQGAAFSRVGARTGQEESRRYLGLVVNHAQTVRRHPQHGAHRLLPRL